VKVWQCECATEEKTLVPTSKRTQAFAIIKTKPLMLNRKTSVFFLKLTLRRLMSYIYMEHPFLMFLDHTQRRSTFGRTPLDE